MLNKLENFLPTPVLAYILIVLATFLWGMSIVIVRGVHEEIPPIGLSFLRWFLGAIFLMPFVWLELFRKYQFIKQYIKLIFLLGILQVGSSAMLMVSVNFTTAINASVINAAQPALTAVAAWVLTCDRITMGQGIGIFSGLIGILIIVGRGDVLLLLSLDLNLGDGFAVLAITGWGIYAVLLHRFPRELGMTTTLFLIVLTGSLATLPFYIWESLSIRTVPFTFDTAIVVLVLGIIVSVFSIFFWNAGIRSVGPNKASIFLNMIPIFGAVLAIIFLGEQLFSFHLFGAVLVGLGITLVIKRGGQTVSQS